MSKFVLGGSLELVGKTVQAGVLVGTHAFDMNDTLRYVAGSTSKMQPNETVEEYLFRVYDNSTGSLLTNDFDDNGTFQ